ncbi:tetratricopeptide repeat-containing sensor histidine kinase [Pollutibacter soli]|uniref:tetratricopeptide repeat-containing sensor histidine kinase n=1 Tax=Pollutibacter soli TaxID=3034157 RepID=UPI003013C304
MKFFVLLIALMIQLVHSSPAQVSDRQRLDSIKMAINVAENDEKKLDLMLDAIMIHSWYDLPDAFVFEQEAFSLADKTGNQKKIAELHYRIGRVHWRRGNFKVALDNHFKSLKIFRSLGESKMISNVMISIAQDYLDSGSYQEAKKYLADALQYAREIGEKRNVCAVYDIQAYLYEMEGNTTESAKALFEYLKITEELGDKVGIAHGAIGLGLNMYKMENEIDALKYFRMAIKAFRETGEHDEIPYVESLIGDIYKKNGNPAEALKHYQQGLKVAEEQASAQSIAHAYNSLGGFYLQQQNFAESRKNFLIALERYRSVSNRGAIANVFVALGGVYTGLKEYRLAKISFDSARSYSKDLKSSLFDRDYYHGVQLLDSATGNWKNAYLNYRQFTVARDSTFNSETLKKLVASQMQYESDKKTAEAKAEQEKKDVLAAAKLRRQRNIRNFSIAGLALAIAFTVVVYRQRNKLAVEKKRTDDLLKDKELLLREIHHRVKNNLEVVSSLLALQSAQIDDPNTKDAMLAGQNRVQSIGIVHQKLYQGDALGTIEMKDYFINLSESILDSFGAEGRVQVECAMERLNVDIDTAVPLGLIVNELLTNTLKYAFPNGRDGKVQISLQKKEKGILQLVVSDNGVGKNGDTKGTGFGGQLVALLTTQLNGTMKEVSANGTHLYFEFKVDRAA